MEAILKEAGSCGGYQAFHLFFAQMPRFLAAWAIAFMMFGGFDPGWRCDLGKTNNNNIYATRNHSNSNVTYSYNASVLDYSNPNAQPGGLVDVVGKSNSSKNGISPHYSLITTTNTTFTNDSSNQNSELYDGTCVMQDACPDGIEFNPSSRTVVTEFKLVCDREWILRAVIFIQSLGVLTMPLLAGIVGDKFGRKFSLYGCTAIICVFSGVAIASHHWVMFAICYFFIGGASNSVIGIAPVFTLEVLNSKWRGYYNSLPTANLAMFLFTVVSYVLRNWVSLHIITCLTGFVSCIGFLLVPESPRWLLVNGRVNEAEKSIQTIATFNRKGRIGRRSFRTFRETVEKQQTGLDDKRYSLLDMLRNRRLAIITIKFCVLFAILSASYMSVSYGLSSLPGSYYTNAMIALGVEVLFVTCSGPLCNWIGRRFTGLLFGSIGAVSCLVIVISFSTMQESSSRIWIVNMFASFAKSSSQSMFCVGTTFSSELYPTVVRSVAIGLIRCSVGIGAIITPFIMPSKDDHSLTVYFGAMLVCYLVTCVIFPSLPETKGRNMADVLARHIIDNDEALEVMVVDGDANGSGGGGGGDGGNGDGVANGSGGGGVGGDGDGDDKENDDGNGGSDNGKLDVNADIGDEQGLKGNLIVETNVNGTLK